ncbi:Mitogen-activated protein kinase [Phytophthora palmivora]|uniref:Mitogen-activated protein kinase n=1 Tax=Phytophthora palmivora TaxID=4796 RepID=A0A2P4XAZ4_9STRA|nr:Mitogen-activated protein kinase [Phytophthora palmivora]
MYPGAPADSLDLLKQMLSFNPESRISVDKALAHPFLESVRRSQSETVESNPFGMEFENVPLNKEALKGSFTILEFLLQVRELNEEFCCFECTARIFEEIKLFADRNNRR